MIKFSLYLENLEFKSDALIIVDVQNEFSNFIPRGFIKELDEYAKNFKKVYQIWDGHIYKNKKNIKIDEPSFTFNNQVDSFRKVYGTTASKDVKELGEIAINLYPNCKEGDKFAVNDQFKLDENGENYIVRIENNHKWFYVNKELVNFFNSLSGQNVELVGGAMGECLHDVHIALKSFGVNVFLNKKYTYSAKTSNKQIFKK